MNRHGTSRRSLSLTAALLLIVALAACTSDDDSPGEDTGVDTSDTSDTTEDTSEPTEPSANLIIEVEYGGSAKVVAISAAVDGEEALEGVYADELEADCSRSWRPSGALCDRAPTTSSTTISSTHSEDVGSTWYAIADWDDDQLVTGLLVIDACNDGSCTTIAFDEARVFQMFSDGKLTHLRLATHPATGDTAPAWDDAGWVTVTGFEEISAGTELGTEEDGDDEWHAVEDPTVIAITPRASTRYLRVEARNDGRYGYETYTELRSLKLFRYD